MLKVHVNCIVGKVADQIEGWLNGRHQRVVLNGSQPSWLPVLSGIPQGSVLGPVLLTIYINNTEQNVHLHTIKFADDTKVFQRTASNDDRRKLEEDLQTLVK